VSRLYEPLHPAILRTRLVVARKRRRNSVAVCGEMAGSVLLALLVGLGSASSVWRRRHPPRERRHPGAARRRPPVWLRTPAARTTAEVENLLSELTEPAESRRS
jgi:hypothetical protein